MHAKRLRVLSQPSEDGLPVPGPSSACSIRHYLRCREHENNILGKIFVKLRTNT